MWLHWTSLLVFGFLVLAAIVDAEDTVAVALVDIKFDDKVALWTMLLDSQYSKVVAITTGIDAHGQAAYELEQYLERQYDWSQRQGHELFPRNKISILQSPYDKVLQETPGHETWWNENPSVDTPEANAWNLRSELSGKDVRIFQLAPTAPEQVQTIIEAADWGSIKYYMLLHGYNSMQRTMDKQTEFLRGLRDMILDRNPDAKVVFTSSFQSYPGKNGGKQKLADIMHMFPQHDVDQALRDPFWSRQILKPYQEQLVDIPFFVSDPEQLDKIIYEARLKPDEGNNPARRENIANYIRHVLNQKNPYNNHKVYGRLQYTLLPEFTGPTTIELADANHVAAFHRYLKDSPSSGLHAEYVHYPEATHQTGSAVKFESGQGPRGEVHGIMLQNGNPEEDLRFIKDLARIPH